MSSNREDQRQMMVAEERLASAFSPHAPINASEVFRGRIEQLRDVIDVINAEGLHAVIYGDRGVGKTSLANILHERITGPLGVSKTICGQRDTFVSVIRRATDSIKVSFETERTGLVGGAEAQSIALSKMLDPANASQLVPDDVARVLTGMPPALFVIDEFDRLKSEVTDEFADLIKACSDRRARSTFVLVGVAEDIDALLQSHESVTRNLQQIHIPRMADSELGLIIDDGLDEAQFTIEKSARARIISISQGFPHFTHLLTQSAGRVALDSGRLKIANADVEAGISRAVDKSDQSLRSSYHKASSASRRNSRWREAIAACALTAPDDRGYFSARKVAEIYGQMLKQKPTPQHVSYYLGKLIQPHRGPLLERTGNERQYRYRFVNPLMRPYVLMVATRDKMLSELETS